MPNSNPDLIMIIFQLKQNVFIQDPIRFEGNKKTIKLMLKIITQMRVISKF